MLQSGRKTSLMQTKAQNPIPTGCGHSQDGAGSLGSPWQCLHVCLAAEPLLAGAAVLDVLQHLREHRALQPLLVPALLQVVVGPGTCGTHTPCPHHKKATLALPCFRKCWGVLYLWPSLPRDEYLALEGMRFHPASFSLVISGQKQSKKASMI